MSENSDSQNKRRLSSENKITRDAPDIRLAAYPAGSSDLFISGIRPDTVNPVIEKPDIPPNMQLRKNMQIQPTTFSNHSTSRGFSRPYLTFSDPL